MKTTIDIADDLFAQGKRLADRENVTLRSLVEEGLRYVLTRRGESGKFHWKPVIVKGRGLSRGFADAGWAETRNAIYPGPDSAP
jgi:hypothetical protein